MTPGDPIQFGDVVKMRRNHARLGVVQNVSADGKITVDWNTHDRRVHDPKELIVEREQSFLAWGRFLDAELVALNNGKQANRALALAAVIRMFDIKGQP